MIMNSARWFVGLIDLKKERSRISQLAYSSAPTVAELCGRPVVLFEAWEFTLRMFRRVVEGGTEEGNELRLQPIGTFMGPAKEIGIVAEVVLEFDDEFKGPMLEMIKMFGDMYEEQRTAMKAKKSDLLLAKGPKDIAAAAQTASHINQLRKP